MTVAESTDPRQVEFLAAHTELTRREWQPTHSSWPKGLLTPLSQGVCRGLLTL